MKNNRQLKPGDKFARPQRLKIRPLRRVLRTTHLFSIAYGDVGSSIYYALGVVALAASGATPLALGLAGIIFVFTALSYAEGTAMYPESGGSASFARHGFNDFAGFIAGWGLMFGYIVTISISAFAIPSYLGFFWAPLKASPVVMTSCAMLIVAFLMTVNVIGVRESSIMNISLALLDLATQALLITLALMFFFNPQIIIERILNYWPSPQDFLFGIAIAAIAFTGLETISQMAEETKRPEVRAPRALVIMTIVVLVVYAGISVSAFSTMTPTELATNWATDPIAGIASKLSQGMNPAEFAAQFFHTEAYRAVFTWILSGLQAILPVLVAVLAATILLIATNAGLLGISRLAFSLSRFKLVPAIMGKVHPRFKTPYFSIILFAGIAILLQSPGFLRSQHVFQPGRSLRLRFDDVLCHRTRLDPGFTNQGAPHRAAFPPGIEYTDHGPRVALDSNTRSYRDRCYLDRSSYNAAVQPLGGISLDSRRAGDLLVYQQTQKVRTGRGQRKCSGGGKLMLIGLRGTATL